MCRWGIVLGRQMMFSTDDEDVARRFMTMENGFRVYDHETGYYVYIDLRASHAGDLISEDRGEPRARFP